MIHEVFVLESSAERLDVFLSQETELTRSHIKKLIESGNITVNGVIVKSGKTLNIGDTVDLLIPEPQALDAAAENIPIDIVYEDKDLAVINKPQGMTVHPASGNYTGTLVNALLYHLDALSGINGAIRPGIVHRLDKDTSGLLVVAKNDKAHVSLSKQIAEKTCKRIYRAIVDGIVKDDNGTIITNIGRSPADRKKMAVVQSGRQAITNYKVLQRFSRNTYIEFQLQTGRTHQIRVHSKHIGHPVTGDPVYNKKESGFNLSGQLLHAYYLSFVHPVSGEKLEFSAALPETFIKVLEKLNKL